MSNHIKDLYDYDLDRKRCRYGIISLKSNFHERYEISDGIYPQCKFCLKKFLCR